MVKIIISGALGAMGRSVAEIIKNGNKAKVVAGYDINNADLGDYNVYNNLDALPEADVMIDFSHFKVVDQLIDYCVKQKIGFVCATTGLENETIAKLNEASRSISVFKTGNFSYGISVLEKLVAEATKLLSEDFDVEIIEKHHNKKIDAPSGTALMLADDVLENSPKNLKLVYGREGKASKRKEDEVTMHAVRGGTIVGEHSVIFAGEDEVIEISHTAYSKKVFAAGAVKAAIYIAGKENGYYSMENIV